MENFIDRLVSVSITRQTGVQGQPGVNDLVILADETPETSFGDDLVKRYSINSKSAVGTDWGTSSDVYTAFTRMTQQERKTKYVYIAKRTAAVATVVTLTLSGALSAGHTVAGAVNGTAISVLFATSSAATVAAVAAAIDAVEGVASAVVSGGDLVITITATTEWVLSVGTFTATGAGSPPTIAKATPTPGRTVIDDLTDIFTENNNPYLVYLMSVNKGAIKAAASDIESRRKLLFSQSSDADIPVTGSSDIASQLGALNYFRTALFYTTDDTQHYAAGLAALGLSYAPGAVAFHNKAITGATPDTLTSTEVGYLDDKNANMHIFFTPNISGVQNGLLADGSQIHTTRDLDYFQTTLEDKIANALTQNPKIPFNRAGFALVGDQGRAIMAKMINEHVFDADVPAVLTDPDPAEIPEADKTAHLASGYTGSAKIEGAMLKVSFDLSVAV